MSFCTSCGAAVTKAQYAPPTAPSATAPAMSTTPTPSAPRGPPGRTMSPVLVLVLTVVTLGIYLYFHWWRITKEMDAFAGKPRHAHGLARIGIPISVIGMIVFVTGYALIIGTIVATDPTAPEPPPGVLGAVIGGGALALLGGLAAFAGSVVTLVALYRMWETLEGIERAMLHPAPLSAGLMIAFAIVAKVAPFIGFVFLGIALYMTQDHMNRLWADSSRA